MYSLAHGLFIFATTILYFCFGWIFFSRALFTYYKISSKIPQIAFSMTFTIGCSVFQLLIFEIVNVLDSSSRWLYWKIDLYTMLVLCIFVLPWYQFYLFTSSLAKSWQFRMIAALGMQCLFLYVVWKLGDMFPVLKQQTGVFSFEMGISRVGIVGVALLATLSGYGAINFPATNMSLLLKPTDAAQVAEAASRLRLTLDSVRRSKRELALERKNNRAPVSKSRGGFFSGWFSAPSKKTFNENSLLREESLAQELYLDYHNLKMQHASFKRSHTTWKGRILNFASYFLTGYCVWKLVMSTINVALRRKRGIDPVTRFMGIALTFLQLDINVEQWAQLFSFMLIGVMIAFSIRGFLNNMMKIFRAFSSSESSNSVVVFMAWIMGIYFISTLILIRVNLPVAYRETVMAVLGDIKFDFYDTWFDSIFVIAATITIGTYNDRKHAK